LAAGLSPEAPTIAAPENTPRPIEYMAVREVWMAEPRVGPVSALGGLRGGGGVGPDDGEPVGR
jgi:hypothetical protein